jgi:hypothetical protein
MVMDILNGLKMDGELDDRGLVDFGGVCLTGIYQSLKSKHRAEEDLVNAITRTTAWGPTLFVESTNPETVHLAQKKGYNVVVRKDPVSGMIKIGARPDGNRDLTLVYQALIKANPQATWFLHKSGKMVLNGSTKQPNMKPSRLSLAELVNIFIKIK